MKRRPRDIGTAAETAAKRWLQDNGWPDADRQPLRGTRDCGDLTVCRSPLIVAEVKAGNAAETAPSGLIGQWLAQTETERVNAGAVLAVLIVRRHRRPVGLWDAHMPAAGWLTLFDGSTDAAGWDSPWPLRASLGDWSAMAKAWVDA